MHQISSIQIYFSVGVEHIQFYTFEIRQDHSSQLIKCTSEKSMHVIKHCLPRAGYSGYHSFTLCYLIVSYCE